MTSPTRPMAWESLDIMEITPVGGGEGVCVCVCACVYVYISDGHVIHVQ